MSCFLELNFPQLFFLVKRLIYHNKNCSHHENLITEAPNYSNSQTHRSYCLRSIYFRSVPSQVTNLSQLKLFPLNFLVGKSNNFTLVSSFLKEQESKPSSESHHTVRLLLYKSEDFLRENSECKDHYLLSLFSFLYT